MSNAIELYKDGGFDVMQRTALAMAKSGYFSDAKSEAQAIVKVMAGAELGMSPFASMTGIHVIQGKATIGAAAMAGIVKNDPRYDYRIIKHDDTICTIQFYENGEMSGVSTFTANDAKKAGTKNMGKYPKNMLFARAMSNGFKWHCAGAGGGMPVYTEGEIVSTSKTAVLESGSVADMHTGEIVEGETFTGEIQEEPPFVPDTFQDAEIKNQYGDGTTRDDRADNPARAAIEIAATLQQDSAGKDGNPTPKMLAKAQKDLSTTCGNNANAKRFIKLVFNVDSSTELTFGHVKTLLDWIGSTHENGWTISPTAIAEAKIVLANE